jgi:MFS family permease
MRLALPAPKTQEDSNFNHLVYDIAWFGIAFPAINRFLSVYAIHLGADSTQLTWMASLPSFVLLFAASMGARWLNRYEDSARATLLPGLGYRLAFLLPALTPFMPAGFQSTWLVLSIAIPAIPQGIAGVTFLVMIRESVSEKQITALASRRSMVFSIALAISGLLMGVWLERAPYPLNYQILFGFAFLMALMSSWHITRVVPSPEHSKPAAKDAARPKVNPFKSPVFQLVGFIIFVTHMSFFSVAALVPLHLVKNLGASESFMGLFGLAELAASATIALFTAQLIARFGSRTMIAVGMVGTGMSLLIVASAISLPVTLIGSAIGGASWTATAIGLFSLFSELTPINERTPYTVAYNQSIYIAMFVGPLIGKSLSSMGLSLVSILIIAAGMRVVAGILTQAHPVEWMQRTLRSHSTTSA